MNKLFTLCFGLMAALAVHAQDEFPIQFADKNGNIIPDGTTLNITTYEDNGFEIQMPSGLYAKNTSSESVHCAGTFTVQSMTNGTFQSCFPGNCMQAPRLGEFTTQDGDIDGNQLKNMLTEWLPEADGTCTVVYQLISYKKNAVTKKWVKNEEGPSITLNFTYNTTNIANAKSKKTIRSTQYYDILGKRIEKPAKGLFIKKIIYSDGSQSVKKQHIY